MTDTDLASAPPERFNLAAYLLGLNSARAEKIAFVDDQSSMSYGVLEHRARSFAAGLRALGVRREERVLLLMLDCNDWPVSFLGAIYAGVVPVCVNTLLTADDYAYMIAHSRCQAVIVSGDLSTLLESALTKCEHEVQNVIVSQPVHTLAPGMIRFDKFIESNSPAAESAATGADDPAFWLYSSGSTGRPKAAVHTHANPYWTAELYGKGVLGLTEQDVCFSAAKLYFAYGLGNGLTFPMSVGATVILMAERATPGAVFARWLGQGAGLRPTVFFGAPTGYAGILAHPDLPHPDHLALRLASSAGEALPADLGERFNRHFGIELIDGIGSTEMCHVYISNRPGRIRPGATGWAVPGYEIELKSEDGAAVPNGEPGDLHVRGPSAAIMYWGNREKSRETFQGSLTKTGDKYIRNDDGSYTYAGRADDMLKVSGIYVSPFEVEATLVQHPAVLEAAVVASEDAEGLTKTKAFVVLKPGGDASAEDLKAFVKSRLAPYKYPRVIEFLPDLPKTATGKIQRFKLRAQR